MVRPGLSILVEQRSDLLAGRRIGVLANQSSILPDLTYGIEALVRAADVRALFSPEHGLYGAAPEGAHVAGATYRAGIPIYSLYGEHLEPPPEQLAGLDAIVCDIQDIGCRFYTYAWTVVKLMQAAARAGVAVIVADRPNPIGGAIEGPGVTAGYRTLVGLHDVPIRHGLTLGELTRLVNAELNLGCDLTVVPCDGWRRDEHWGATGLPWVPPSPNMPAAETALVYPGTCLCEGANVSVGRGTAKPFEWLGAPWIDGAALAERLNAAKLPGLRWRAVIFQPLAEPYTGQVCQGIQPHVVDPQIVRPVLAGVTLLATLRDMYEGRFTISAAGGIYADPEQMARRSYPEQSAWEVAHFDRLAGSTELRQALEAGTPPQTIVSNWQTYEAQFRERSAPALIYA